MEGINGNVTDDKLYEPNLTAVQKGRFQCSCRIKTEQGTLYSGLGSKADVTTLYFLTLSPSLRYDKPGYVGATSHILPIN